MPIRGNRRQAMIALVLGAALSGCANKDLAQYRALSASGGALANAMPALYAASFDAAVRADAELLKKSRAALPGEDQRRAAFDDAHDNLTERRAILADLEKHARLLKRYFDAMGSLAAGDAPSAISASAGGVIDELKALSPAVAAFRAGGADAESFLAPAADLVVRDRIADVLNERFAADAPVIENQLRLHAAALDALMAGLQADLDVLAGLNLEENVREAYAGPEPLPKDWTSRWAEALAGPPEIDAAMTASRAMKDVRAAFIALVEGRGDTAGFELLLREVTRAVALIELIDAGDGDA